jgi:hypothetical protein
MEKGRKVLMLSRNPGTTGIIKKIRETVGDRPVYLSIDVRFPFSFQELLNQQYLRHDVDRFDRPGIRACDWHTRDRRVVDARAAHDLEGIGRLTHRVS